MIGGMTHAQLKAWIERYSDRMPYQAKDGQASGTQNTNGNTAITVNLDTEVVENDNYTLSSNEITVAEAGVYLVSWQGTVNTAAILGTVRGSVDCWVENNSSQTGVEHLESSDYFRQAGQRVSVGGSGLAELAADDSLRLRLALNAGVDAYPLQQHKSWISLLKIS